MHHSRMSRSRLFAVVLLTLLVAGVLAACGAPAAESPAAAPAAQEAAAPAAQEAAPAVAAEANAHEAPALAEMVAAGTLPPLEERLPKDPAVVTPVESIGQYGGTWTSALVGGSDNAWLVRTISYVQLMAWTPQWDGLVPNAALSVDASDDASEYIFHLREGMKWSDGEPFMAQDIAFWWNDQVMNADLTPGGPPAWMRAGEEPAIVEAVDDYTVRFKFSAPNGLFLQNLATPGGDGPTRIPLHYCSQFHQDYNSENLDQMVADNNADDWIGLYQSKCSSIPGTPADSRWYNTDLPTIMAWKLKVAYGEGTQLVMERNPYFWKVDTEGNQLPYIDSVVYDILEDREVLLLKVLNGEIDMSSRHFNTNDNKAVIAENQEAGGYSFFEARGNGNTTGFMFNQTHKDPRMREIFQNKDFRIAMSYCTNRQEIIDVLYIGQGEPMGNAPPKDLAEFYDADWYTEYTAFDLSLIHI